MADMTNEKQTEVINKIRDSYAGKQQSKYGQLKALNEKVKTPPRVLAYVLGIFGTLVLGVGMCICLEVIAKNLMAVGVAVGVIGIAIMVANVFIYKAFLKARKKKYAEQILALVNELGANGMD